MPSDPNNPEVLTSVRTEVEAAAIVGALAARSIEASTTGSYTAGFRAEAPGCVNVIVKYEDLDSARLALAEIEQDQPDVDWSQVDVGEPDEVPGYLACRVIPSVFPDRIDSGQLECHDLVSELRTQVTPQVKELFIHAARDAAHQQLGIQAQQASEFRNTIYCGRQLFWIRPYTVNGCADSQRLAITICNRAPVR